MRGGHGVGNPGSAPMAATGTLLDNGEDEAEGRRAA
jgi:hypothetical protein